MSQALAHICLSYSKSHPHLFNGSVHTLGLDEVLGQTVSKSSQRLREGGSSSRVWIRSQEIYSVLWGKSLSPSGLSFLTGSALRVEF